MERIDQLSFDLGIDKTPMADDILEEVVAKLERYHNTISTALYYLYAAKTIKQCREVNEILKKEQKDILEQIADAVNDYIDACDDEFYSEYEGIFRECDEQDDAEQITNKGIINA